VNLGALIPAILGALIIALGWPIVHYFNSRREVAAEKRRTRVAFLIEAYRRLESAGNRSLHQNSIHIAAIESALADIQLLGTPHQVKLAHDFSSDFAKNGSGTFDPLLYDLRDSLRQELDLEPVAEDLVYLRIKV